ncbi:hypothetical protein ACFONN_17240 [Dyella humi]|uniref:Uncharacterized protein n=1 Tax=Dyella humi TaxID=1770547 RepID=A0ABW8ID18_9GAMM
MKIEREAINVPHAFLLVIPAKAGIHRQCAAWIPAFAGMTRGTAEFQG